MEVLFMLEPFPSCGVGCFVSGMADVAASCISEATYIAAVILGGFVVWMGLIIGRWLINGLSFRSRGRRR